VRDAIKHRANQRDRSKLIPGLFRLSRIGPSVPHRSVRLSRIGLSRIGLSRIGLPASVLSRIGPEGVDALDSQSLLGYRPLNAASVEIRVLLPGITHADPGI
jgi:hypothetical protein